MLKSSLEDVLRQIPAESIAIRQSMEAWRDEVPAAHEFFARVSQRLARREDGPLPAFEAAWRQFEHDLRTYAQLMTPYELVSAFGLTQRYDQLDALGRRSLITGLRRVAPQPRRSFSRADTALWQQQVQGLDDPYMAPARKAWLEGQRPPVAFLDVQQLGKGHKLAKRLGLDVGTEHAIEVKVANVDEAVTLACLFAHTRECDLFRGQVQDWPPAPSILRGLWSKPDEINDRWTRFRAWAESEPAVATYDLKSLWAIAQHYGLPSHMLDFSRNPRVAGFFATHGKADRPEAPEAIYCVNSAAVTAADSGGSSFARFYGLTAKVNLIEVSGLFRMDAQEGAFLEISSEFWTSFFHPDVITFPRGRPVESPKEEDIYPAHKSDIEVLVEAFFAREAA
jgi:hypothetical protein